VASPAGNQPERLLRNLAHKKGGTWEGRGGHRNWGCE